MRSRRSILPEIVLHFVHFAVENRGQLSIAHAASEHDDAVRLLLLVRAGQLPVTESIEEIGSYY